ncbi:MAG TPA: zinc-dependent metalloprotease [Acidimicrobiales bacterium]|nr:zinc-dependent metalloprotease [Acidimicrobiales bacterium]
MSGTGPAGPGDDPFGFGGTPFLGDLAKMLQGAGSGSGGGWETARQLAMQLATGGEPEPNPDPMDRLALEELARVAELRVGAVTGLDVSTTGRPLTVVPVTRSEWARRTIDAWRPLLERLAQSITGPALAGAEEADLHSDPDDPMASMFGGLVQMLGPMMLGLQAGSMVGHLAGRSLGQYDLPIPRPPSDELVVVGRNVRDFGDEWTLPVDDLRLWICLSEITTHAVLGVPHVRAALDGALQDHATSFAIDTGIIESRLMGIDPTNPEALQDALGDPESLLGEIQSDVQRSIQPRLRALTAVIVGYVDHVMDTIGGELISSYSMLTEALHRRRVETGQGERFVELLLGFELGREQFERGETFVRGVLDRGGEAALARLWTSPRELPTPNEVDAPGLWLARIDLPDN